MFREQFAKPLFVATIVAGSFLLFLTQPMVARMALPRLGGAPAVWNSAMLVYQALLLGGYAYAHGIARLGARRQAGLHLALFAVAALWLPIGLAGFAQPSNVAPALWVPWLLIVSIGPLFFIVSAQAPLMQRWYALESSRGEPYALYAASNLGSFAGLISYPLIVEPLLTVQQQSALWTGGYALLVLLVALCALTIPRVAVEEAPRVVTPAPARGRMLYWMALAAVPSGLMLSTTTHLTTDIVAMPLLWVLPLGLYLLSFVLAFATNRRPANILTSIAPVIVLAAGGFAFAEGGQHPFFAASLGLVLLFVVAVALHGELYRLRPAPDHLTGFYLVMSVGGMFGGLFCAIVAPTLFDWTYEHPILILAAALLLPQMALIERIWSRQQGVRWLAIGIPFAAVMISIFSADPGLQPDTVMACSIVIAILAVISLGNRLAFALCLAALMLSHGGWSTLRLSMGDARTRSYFGVYTILDRDDGSARRLTHGTTLHGLQSLVPGQEREPTSYYGRQSGVGLAMASANLLFGPAAHIGVIGLGTGTLACYAQPDQSWHFFEIDPAVVRIARDSGRFSFLSRCAPQAQIIIGDARLTLAQPPPGRMNLLAVDAFSSDSVPMHLLTREAMDVYGRALSRDGILLMHISNRHIGLEPVLAANARAGGWSAAMFDNRVDPAIDGNNVYTSVWVALSRDPASLDRLKQLAVLRGIGWDSVPERAGFAGWSDDHASILPLLRLFN